MSASPTTGPRSPTRSPGPRDAVQWCIGLLWRPRPDPRSAPDGNNRSWTHDSELTAAVLDDERDSRAPADPAGFGDGARRFARRLRLDLMREHLEHDSDTDLLDPDQAAQTVRRRAAALDAWHADGCRGPRPPGRLRRHALGDDRHRLPLRHRWFTVPAYRIVLDPDGRPLGMRLRRAY